VSVKFPAPLCVAPSPESLQFKEILKRDLGTTVAVWCVQR